MPKRTPFPTRLDNFDQNKFYLIMKPG